MLLYRVDTGGLEFRWQMCQPMLYDATIRWFGFGSRPRRQYGCVLVNLHKFARLGRVWMWLVPVIIYFPVCSCRSQLWMKMFYILFVNLTKNVSFVIWSFCDRSLRKRSERTFLNHWRGQLNQIIFLFNS